MATWRLSWVRGCEEPGFELVQRKKRNEVLRRAEVVADASLDMRHPHQWRGVGTGRHAGKVIGQTVIVEEGCHDRLLIAQKATHVRSKLSVSGDTAFEVA